MRWTNPTSLLTIAYASSRRFFKASHGTLPRDDSLGELAVPRGMARSQRAIIAERGVVHDPVPASPHRCHLRHKQKRQSRSDEQWQRLDEEQGGTGAAFPVPPRSRHHFESDE